MIDAESVNNQPIRERESVLLVPVLSSRSFRYRQPLPAVLAAETDPTTTQRTIIQQSYTTQFILNNFSMHKDEETISITKTCNNNDKTIKVEYRQPNGNYSTTMH